MAVTLTTFTAGTTLDPDTVNENFYDGINSLSSLSAINGQLNTNHQSSSWTIDSNHIRSANLWGARMSGQTGVMDYQNLLFEGTDDTGNAIDKMDPIPGAATTFYLPFDPTLVICTWQIVLACNAHPMRDSEDGRTSDGITEDTEQKIRFFMNTTEYAGQIRYAVTGAQKDTSESEHYRVTSRDRIWSGHHLFTGSTALTKGWHTAWLGCYINNSELLRIRIRNIKVLWFK